MNKFLPVSTLRAHGYLELAAEGDVIHDKEDCNRMPMKIKARQAQYDAQ